MQESTGLVWGVFPFGRFQKVHVGTEGKKGGRKEGRNKVG